LASTPAEAAACPAAPSTANEMGAELETATGPLVPEPGETCYEFPVHQSTTDVDDATPYDVGGGEHYEHFYYDIPWPAGTVATRFGSKLDNVKVLHHWLLFRTNETNKKAGYHETAPLPTLSGADALLLSGWALGGKPMVAPEDVGFELPDPGAKLNVQWHFYNSTGEKQVDHSSVQVCTVPAAMRTNKATFSWLGQENLGGNKWLGGSGMPAHKMSTYSGTCKPRRAGMNDTDPINIIVFWPHMHQLGTSMSAVINHTDGTKDTVFDEHFDFASQDHYNVDQKLWPGESITINCNFNNTTDRGVPFGESSDTEMCYMFTYAWPANTLENGASSLIGAKNTCW
jgi:Copper type II ascorbate-dependent monooxygenase, C-terminal domain